MATKTTTKYRIDYTHSAIRGWKDASAHPLASISLLESEAREKRLKFIAHLTPKLRSLNVRVVKVVVTVSEEVIGIC